MRKVTVVNSMSGMLRVHRTGCKDVDKDMVRANGSYKLDIPDDDNIEKYVVADLNDSFGWVDGSNEPPPFTVLDITILPCVKGA